MSWVVLAVALTAFFLTVVYSLRLGIGPVPTSYRVQKALLRLLPEKVPVVYELGSGWGGLVFAVAKEPQVGQVIGYELSPLPYLVAQLRRLFCKQEVQFVRRHFMRDALPDGTVIVCYLYPGAMRRLAKILPKKCTVITHTFALPDLQPDKVVHANDVFHTPVYRYHLH